MVYKENVLEAAVMFYSGPEGVSDQRAAQRFQGVRADDVLPLANTESVIQTVDFTPGTLGILPLQDSLRGEFRQVFDLLIEKAVKSRLVRSSVLAEVLSLQTLDADRTPTVVYSHPDVLSIFATDLAQLGLEGRPVASTHHACQVVQAKGNPFEAAIAPTSVGLAAGLEVSSEILGREVEIRTRYGLLSQSMTEPTNSDHSILYVEPSDDQPGTLLSVLDHFASYEINLRSLRSQYRGRGTPHGFVLEIDGHPMSGPVAACLEGLMESAVAVKILGAFPGDEIELETDRVVTAQGLVSTVNGLRSLLSDGSVS